MIQRTAFIKAISNYTKTKGPKSWVKTSILNNALNPSSLVPMIIGRVRVESLKIEHNDVKAKSLQKVRQQHYTKLERNIICQDL